MKIGYFPGCSLAGTAVEFDLSLRLVLEHLGVQITEIDDWSCCGASSAHAFSKLLAVSLPARNIMLAETQKMDSVMAPCAACYNRLISARHILQEQPEMKTKVQKVLESDFKGEIRILNIIELFNEIGHENIKERMTHDIGSIQAAAYYGCLLVRPNEITHFDDVEHPVLMDELIRLTGAKTVDWNFKTECCGGAHSIARTDVVTDLVEKIMLDAESAGANMIVVACPMCHSNLDMRQLKVLRKKKVRSIPVVYLTELMGLAMGLNPKKLGLGKHFISVPEIKKFLAVK